MFCMVSAEKLGDYGWWVVCSLLPFGTPICVMPLSFFLGGWGASVLFLLLSCCCFFFFYLVSTNPTEWSTIPS